MVAQPSNYRRISYVIPLPSDEPPRLSLPPLASPRNGSIRPLLLPAPPATPTPNSSLGSNAPRTHPRHRLGVSSLALDTCTQLANKSSPEGILYSGGRDGQIIAWDLSLRTRPRAHRYGSRAFGWRRGRWEILTGWADDMDEEDVSDDDVVARDGDVLGDVVDSGQKKRRKSEALADTIPYEDSWELVSDQEITTPPSAFRQSIQTHTDWVNDILLCNMNQTVVSASSDGSIRAWSPHLSTITDPALVGTHGDYVRCLATSSHQNWIASGSFDRTIKLWDISRTSSPPHASTTPLTTLSLPTPSQKSSVYALSTDQFGSIIASGSPERVVRMWDPRTGKRTGKLVGHTDIIRAIVLSPDGRYLLTGSADASIKLWSLAAQRCLHTFAHHTDSVWALSSQHPSLEIFYSGDRSGIVSRVDMEGCNSIDEGECLVVCNASRLFEYDNHNHSPSPARDGTCTPGNGFRLQDASGVNKIIALDDRLVWTATGASSIKRWKAPPRRALRTAPAAVPTSPEGTTFVPSLLSSNSRRTSGSSDVPSHKRGFSLSVDTTRRVEDEVLLGGAAAGGPSPATPRSTKHFSSPAPTTNTLHSPDELALQTQQTQTHLYGIPYHSLVRLVSPHDPYSYSYSLGRGVRRHGSRDTGIATLYSAASVKSVPMSPSRHSVSVSPPAPGPTATATATPAPAPSTTTTAAAPRPRASFRQSTGETITITSRLTSLAPEPESPQPTPRAQYEERDLAATAVPLEKDPEDTIAGDDGLVRAVFLNDRMHVVTVSMCGWVRVWDVVRCRCVGWFDRSEVFTEMGCGRTREPELNSTSASAPPSTSTTASASSDHPFHSPREVLEMVRERIEGESVIAPWATADTRVGNLTVHLLERCFDTEIYADEAGYVGEIGFDTEQRLNVAKWVLSNLFERFVREELQRLHRISQGTYQRAASAHDSSSTPLPPLPGDAKRKRSISALSKDSTRSLLVSAIVADPSMAPAIVPDMSLIHVRREAAAAALATPLIPIAVVKDGNHHHHHHLAPIPQSPGTPGSAGTAGTGGGTPVSSWPRRSASDTPSLHGSRSSVVKEPAAEHTASASASSPTRTKRLSETSATDDFSGWTGPGFTKDKDRDRENIPLPPTPVTPSTGGFMGRLRSLGKSSKRPVSGEVATSPGGSLVPRAAEGVEDGPKTNHQLADPEPETEQSRFLGTLISQAFYPPSSTDAPPLNLPLDTEIILAEESPPGWTNVYRGSVGSTSPDAGVLERVMPLWLMQYLLANKTPLVPNVKVSFGVAPWPGQGDGSLENAPTRLTANRYLRVRKILGYVQEKIDRPNSRSTSRSGSISGATPRSSTEAALAARSGRASPHVPSPQKPEIDGKKVRAEDAYEVLCNDVVLPLDMTLASIRHYVWRSSSELVLFYRRKV